MIAYRGPTLITEPELRWPIVLLAAAITALLAILTAGLYYVAMTRPDLNETGRAVMQVTSLRVDSGNRMGGPTQARGAER
jgi:hypothetical protein